MQKTSQESVAEVRKRDAKIKESGMCKNRFRYKKTLTFRSTAAIDIQKEYNRSKIMSTGTLTLESCSI